MPEPRDDDLFRESTMTFGEHLGELRVCLFKAVIGLLVGFLIGLLIGDHVSIFIQRPLSNALTRYYQEETENRVGHALTPAQVNELVKKEHLLADEYKVDAAQILQELKHAYPKQFTNVELPPPAKPADEGEPEADAGEPTKLIPIFLWHASKDDPRLQAKGMAVLESFSIYVKTSLLVGALLASPWIFYQIWHFVAAGLYPHERRYVHRYLPFSVALFLLGASLAFFVVFEPVLNFLLRFNRSQGIIPEPRINEWLSFVMILPIGFGIGFQLPLVMLFLERIGVFSVRSYLSQWRIAVLVIFTLAAILTPPDPYSMMLMACPLTFLYFGGILLCKFMPRKSSPFERPT